MLYKTIAMLLSALFIAATLQVSTASAGGCGRGGFHAFQAGGAHQRAVKQSRARKAARAQSIAAAKQRKKAVQQAKIEKKTAPVKVAAVEPAPAKTETVAEKKTEAVAEKANEDKIDVASVEQPTCTKFFAETGTTVTVECTKE